MSSNATRAWLKPSTLTTSLIAAVGRPWEIYRSNFDAASNRVVDLYTKSGNVGAYSAMLAVIPDLGVGFSILVATEVDGRPYVIADWIAEIIIPAVEEVARKEADSKFAGTYTAKNLNSTITLST